MFPSLAKNASGRSLFEAEQFVDDIATGNVAVFDEFEILGPAW